VSALYVYAVLDATPAAGGAGLAGEPVRFVTCGELVVATGEMMSPPTLAAETLRAHDAVVRRLADVAEAILPARFGGLLGDERALEEAVALRAPALREALRRVAGREQMTLRVWGDAGGAGTAAEASSPVEDTAGGPGTRYLAMRRERQRHEREVPEIAALRPLLTPLVRGERVERHDAGGLVATVYHLIDRGESARYLATVEQAAAGATWRTTASGPWPPYAFAPEDPP
jgi:hypothetical protein